MTQSDTTWKNLKSYFETIKNKRIVDFFKDKNRLDNFSFQVNHIYFDFSKNHWDAQLLNSMIDWANHNKLQEGISNLFSGKKINYTEKRAVLHTALRQQTDEPVLVDDKNIIPEIRKTQQQIKLFTEKVTGGEWKGITGKKITDIVNIGIGGSDLGPKMIVQALSTYRNHLKVHFLSNIDPFQLDKIIGQVDLESTLFIIVSKSFSTQETLTNAQRIQALYIERFGKKAIANHFISVSTQVEKAKSFGIDENNIFPMWDWVGGRFSLWSPAGIAIPLSIGYDNFNKLLIGANQMDLHFKTSDFDKNMPVLAAFLSILYNNLFGYESEAYIPYAEKLKYLPDFLQQLLMESNGKYIDKNNQAVNYQTGNIVWGNTGTNAQHSFFQLLHQGTKMVPVHFIAEKENYDTEFGKNHQILLSNMIAQSEALMIGEKNTVPYKNFEGNRPSTTLLLDKITPESIGNLISYFEHKTFVEGWLWHINSFDQYGVELGKKLAQKVLKDLQDKKTTGEKHDPSTQQLIDKIKNIAQ